MMCEPVRAHAGRLARRACRAQTLKRGEIAFKARSDREAASLLGRAVAGRLGRAAASPLAQVGCSRLDPVAANQLVQEGAYQ